LIKQDIVHHVIERTGLPRTKAEAAVDTVFEGLKQALASASNCADSAFLAFVPAKQVSVAIPAPAPK
jgi:DNA-binding protein HU-beta